MSTPKWKRRKGPAKGAHVLNDSLAHEEAMAPVDSSPGMAGTKVRTPIYCAKDLYVVFSNAQNIDDDGKWTGLDPNFAL